jgi:hypothetical protein
MKSFLIYKFILNLLLSIGIFIESSKLKSSYYISTIFNKSSAPVTFFQFNDILFNDILFKYIIQLVLQHLQEIYKDYGDIYLYIIIYEWPAGPNNKSLLPRVISQPYIFNFNSYKPLPYLEVYNNLVANMSLNDWPKTNIGIMVRFVYQPFSIKKIKKIIK